MKQKKKQPSPTVSMRLDEADKKILRKVASLMGTSQTEAVRILVRERLASYSQSRRAKLSASELYATVN